METKKRKTRLHVLATLVKNEYNSIILLSLVVTLSILPFVTFFLSKSIYEASLLNSYPNPTQEEITLVLGGLFQGTIVFSCISAVVIPLTYLLLGGAINYALELIYKGSKPGFAKYWEGIVKGAPYSILSGVVTSIVYVALSFLKWGNGEVYGLSYWVLLILSLVFVYPVLAILMFEGVIYHGKLGRAIKNAFILYLSEPGKNVIVFLLLAVYPILIAIFDTEFAVYAAFPVFAFFVFGALLILLSLRMLSLFDEKVNRFNYPELLNKGMAQYEEKEKENA